MFVGFRNNKYHQKSSVFAVLAIAMISTFLPNCITLAVFFLAFTAGAVAGHRTDPLEIMLDVQRIFGVFAIYTDTFFVA